MLDWAEPISRRTRLREAQFYKDYFEKKKEEENNGANSTGQSKDRRVKSGRSHKVCDEGKKANVVTEDLGSDHGIDSKFLAGSNCCEEEVATVEEIELDALDEEATASEKSLDVENPWGKNGESSEGRGPIVVDDGEDDVIFLGQQDLESVGLRDEKGRAIISIDDNLDDEGVVTNVLNASYDTSGVPVISSNENGGLGGSNADGRKSSGVEGRKHSQIGSLQGSEETNSSSDDDVSADDLDESETSSEDDNDASSDEDYFVRSEGSGSYSEGNEDEEIEVFKSGTDKNRKEEKVEVGVKRKFGPTICIDSDNDSGNSGDEDNNNSVSTSQENHCVARRTRSHFTSRLRKMKLGSMSRPLCIDHQLVDLSVDDNSEDDGESVDNDEAHLTGQETMSNEEDDGCLQKVGKKKEKRHACKLNTHDVIKVVVNSILHKDDMLPEETASPMDKIPKQEVSYLAIEPTLPLKFTFGTEESSPPEKSEFDKELDKLWEEADLARISCEIDSGASNMVENEDAGCLDTELNTAMLCRKGSHFFVLDEEIGVKCKFCSFVEQEVKYIVPSFGTNLWGRLDRRDSDTVDNSIFDDLHGHNSDCEFMSVIDPYTIGQGTVWDMIPGVKNSMYPHQREGFEFIWNNIAGGISLEKLKIPTSFYGGSGCIISHAPGTGKTRLTIVFLQTYMKVYPTCRPVIVAPRSMLLTWEEEIKKWKVGISFHNLNKPEFSGNENERVVRYLRQTKNGTKNVSAVRMVKLYSWKKDGGILGISYRLFETLAGDDDTDKGKAQKGKGRHKAKDEKVRKILLELPGLFIFDEGHTPRNDQTCMWKALSKIKTDRRIILSGTPFQNNFDELFNTLCLVMPKFGDKISSRHRRDHKKQSRTRNEAKEKWASLTSSIGKVADGRLKGERLKEVRAIVAPFVHVHKGKILQESLPGLRHSMVVLRPAHLQKSLLTGLQQTKNAICLDVYVSLLSVHPSLLSERHPEQEELSVERSKLERSRLDPDAGVKTKFVFELLRLSQVFGEKVLVFAQFLEPLALIKDQLKTCLGWTQGKEVLYMDGARDVKQRQLSIKVFNDPGSEVKVLLASTKACSEGISLVGASRVVLLDVAWNPSVERQAISRAYRLGQKKVVYVYHLITTGTMEEDKFNRQAEKRRMSELVFSPNDRKAEQQKTVPAISEDKILAEMFQHRKLKHMFEKIYQQNESNLIETFDLVDL